MPLFISVVVAIFSLPSSASASQAALSWFKSQGFVGPEGTRIIACHGYGCSRRQVVSVDGGWLGRARAILKGGRASAEAERQALSQVVSIYTAYLAASIGGKRDVPGSPAGMSGVHGQMDCLDETANTTSLLLVLQGQGLLAHHQVEPPESRGFFLDGRYPHFSAVIVDESGTEWAVDPWRRAPGQKPEILPLVQWRQDS
ncbi:hypothetical protein MHY87_03640 [Microvirga sp. ACRRW]|uniref:hypothetical protein n=1 Tax=Microvirga sp. ACRRW TaxID=2918205 RepID=UPI001EF5FB47|nr:hypothetical protein [Microvirga sp. ACRRW]MCG7391992.1 hypothetical protein [Microvirga sp. ACRRW]